MFKVNDVEIEETYCEAFDGLFCRVILTAEDEDRLKKSSYDSTALPLTVFDESEAGIETWLDTERTPDDRSGSILQFWVNERGGVEKLEEEFAKRVRQGILVVPGTRVFDYGDSKKKFSTLEKIGHCGDGYEWKEKRFGRRVINIPIMMGEFLIEESISYGKGVMGGNIWFFCESYDSGVEAGEAALSAIKEVDGVIAPFDVCSAGSKVETDFPEIGPTTNHRFCPTLRNKIEESEVPRGIEAVPEIVINGTNEKSVREAMKVGIEEASKINGVKKISAGNFGGNLGSHLIRLREMF